MGRDCHGAVLRRLPCGDDAMNTLCWCVLGLVILIVIAFIIGEKALLDEQKNSRGDL